MRSNSCVRCKVNEGCNNALDRWTNQNKACLLIVSGCTLLNLVELILVYILSVKGR